jgi:hypothetical protein
MVKTLAIKEYYRDRSLFALSSFLYERLFGSIPSCSQFFSLYLSTGERHWSDNHTLRLTTVRTCSIALGYP